MTFINAKEYTTRPSAAIEKVAKEWVQRNAKFIWGIRCLIYMKTDDYFWDDNAYSQWRDLYFDNFQIELPKIQSKLYDAAAHRFRLPQEIISLFNEKDRKNIEYIIDSLATYRELLGETPHYGSFWNDNFSDDGLDHIIFEQFTP